MPAHPCVRHLPEPPVDEVFTIGGTVPGVVSLWYSLAGGLWLDEGCEVLASTERGEVLVRYRCSDDDLLYEGWVSQDAVQLMGRAIA